MNINKKTLIIFSSIILLIVIAVIFNISTGGKNSLVSKSTLYDNKYYVEEGLEGYVPIIKNSVENFASQNIKESVESRNKRLSDYFTADSPVYGYGQENVDELFYKSEANLTSVSNITSNIRCDDIEKGNVCLLTNVNLKYYSQKSNYSEFVEYWVIINKSAKDKYKAYDIGILKW